MIPDNQKITQDVFIPQGKDMGAVTGHKVVVQVMDFGGVRRKPEGEIVEIIGHVNDPGTDILSLVRAYGLPEGFPEDVMAETGRISQEVEETDKKGRLALRDLQTVTGDSHAASQLK